MASLQDEAIGDLRKIIDEMKEKLTSMSECIEKAEEVYKYLEEAKKSEILSPQAEINEKFSDAANFAIANSEGPLKPEDLKQFLTEGVFGNRRQKVLPIVEKYKAGVEEVIVQLTQIKKCNNQIHMHYKEEQRRLDLNLNKKIDRLVSKIRKESGINNGEKRTQLTVDRFFKKQRR